MKSLNNIVLRVKFLKCFNDTIKDLKNTNGKTWFCVN